MWLLVLAFVQGAAADSYAAVAFDGGCQNNVGCAGFYRAFVAATSPALSTFGPPSTVTGISAAAIGIQAASNGMVSSGNVDVAGLKFRTPADTSDNNKALNFYYGYLGVSGVWDNRTATGSIAGAFLEISSSIDSIQVYYDKDGTSGFQWDLKSQNDIYVCTGSWDCIDTNGKTDVKGLVWTPISRTVVNCSDVVPNAGYSDDCTIHTFTTTGSQSGATVLTITARTASQAITVNGVLISPLKVKFDVDVAVPWSSWPLLSDATHAKVALIFVHAGKAGGGSAIASLTSSGASVVSSLVFNGANGKASYFGYTGTATVDGSTSNVVTQRITGAQIEAYKGGLTATSILVGYLQIFVGIAKGFGWSLEITIHSWANEHPVAISWDPEVGMADQAKSSSTLLVPAAGALLLALFY